MTELINTIFERLNSPKDIFDEEITKKTSFLLSKNLKTTITI